MGILARILEEKAREVAVAKARVPVEVLLGRLLEAPPPRDFAAALRKRPDADAARRPCTPRVIAEVKRASPSAGPIRPHADAPAIAAEYEAAGAAAISVLTDEKFFHGSLDDLSAVRARVGLPVLRKEFVVDPYQVLEARAAGADAVLLIVAALDDARLSELVETTRSLDMTPLVEVHDEREAERALAAGADVIGVNHRDLATFEIDMGLSARLRGRVPADCLLVGESGIRTAADVRALAEAGVDAILVGETLMRQPSPGAALRALLS